MQVNSIIMQPNYPILQTRFCKHSIELNGLDGLGFESWTFCSGMLFGAQNKWWNDGGTRGTPHEGLDVCLFKDVAGQFHNLGEGTLIPVIDEGEIIKIDTDFLGKSVYIKHNIHDGNNRQLHTVYGHTKLQHHIGVGMTLSEGSILGTIAGTRHSKSKIAPHLHISIAWIPRSLSHQELGWEVLRDPDVVTLLDPLKAIAFKYIVVSIETVHRLQPKVY